jgi:ribosomal protein S18 acetylase RimI-like enzyme
MRTNGQSHRAHLERRIVIGLRGLRWPDDRAALLALDTSFTTGRVYRVVVDGLAFALREESVAPRLRKAYDLSEDIDDLPQFDAVAIAEAEGRVAGLAALRYEAWNRRAVLWHLYVDPACRGRGAGRALLERATQAARRLGARCVWLETQNVNHGAIQFYRRMGFACCGLDLSLYDPHGPAAGEVAIFFSLVLT